ncbi:hypothetical protein ACD591_16405 [Rufibacter glacialis]|uniref:Uncharacterized protein n=1 Tax=Rufibacter glacialis TaxID=1259555 RepID=A0A5M8QS37_9BACT|nr:hypothetical protein [Rufibacter glacialis]KAA6437476.1 hypothetical protein FOE74_02955 [Rufibacter glacialis]GGK59050.1 hypothetical protein GCM10011405_03860 [Rufibacter glacialis]
MTEQQLKSLALLDKYFSETPKEQIEQEIASYAEYGASGMPASEYLGRRIASMDEAKGQITNAGQNPNNHQEITFAAAVLVRHAEAVKGGKSYLVDLALAGESNYAMAA